MTASAEHIVHRLANLDPESKDGPSLIEDLYEIVDQAEELADQAAVLPDIFAFFEKWPLADVGSPGPLVHFVEKFFPGGYEEQLLESLGRRPVSHTVWMANRLLNSKDVTENLRAYLISALEAAVEHPRSGSGAREDAKRFLEHQRSSRSRE